MCNFKELELLGISFIETEKDLDHCVLIVHGFGGSKTGKEYIFKRFSDYLASKEVSSFRFDFLGCGESYGDYNNITYEKMQDQLKLILNILQKKYKSISIVGISVTTFIILPVLEEIKNNNIISEVIFWNPIISTNKYKTRINNKLIDNKYYIDSFIMPVDYLQGVEDLLQLEVNEKIYVIHGELDKSYENEEMEAFLEHFNASFTMISNTNHTFSNYDAMQKLFRKTYKEIRKTKNLDN